MVAGDRYRHEPSHRYPGRSHLSKPLNFAMKAIIGEAKDRRVFPRQKGSTIATTLPKHTGACTRKTPITPQ
jgi:hypothetical protein